MSILSHSVHTGLFVENVEKMVLFYRDIISFETDWDGGSFASFKVNDGGLFMFDRKQFAEAMNQPYHPPQGFNQTMEIGIGVPTKADVDREYDRLMALGVHSVQELKTHPWGQRTFWIVDPEGNYIEVGSFQDRFCADGECSYHRVGWPPVPGVSPSARTSRGTRQDQSRFFYSTAVQGVDC